jgi:hypothetical protein
MRYLKPFNENTDNFEEELKDFCENNLAYLIDEGLDISVWAPTKFFKGFKISLDFNSRNDNPRLWNDIKDHMIPFLTRLSNQYEIKQYPRQDKKDIMIGLTRDLEAAKNHWPHRKTELYYQVNKLINDDTKSGVFYAKLSSNPNVVDDSDDVLYSYITEFEFIIGGYKEKKSVVTKIKSFFK